MYRVLFSGNVILTGGIQYALVARQESWWNNISLYWRYKAGSAQYPYGNRFYSQNGGTDWTSYPSDDHIFLVWGTPPAIPPPPVPPEDKWAPIKIQQIPIPGGFEIILDTEAPAHTFLYWTDKEPWTHRQGKRTRGLNVLWDAYWCYVVWNIIEQNEPGDTLRHTFLWLGWEHCQVKYFRFVSTVNGEVVPSDSPVYTKHYTYPLPDPLTVGGTPLAERNASATWTYISGLNPAISDFTLRRVTLWAYQYPLNDLELAIMYQTTPNHFTTRSHVMLLPPAHGGEQDIIYDNHLNLLDLDVRAGDYIGAYWNPDIHGRGGLGRPIVATVGGWLNFTGDVIPCVHVEFGQFDIAEIYLVGKSY